MTKSTIVLKEGQRGLCVVRYETFSPPAGKHTTFISLNKNQSRGQQRGSTSNHQQQAWGFTYTVFNGTM